MQYLSFISAASAFLSILSCGSTTSATALPSAFSGVNGVQFNPISPDDIPSYIKNPVSPFNGTNSKRDTNGAEATMAVYVCTDANFTGYCVRITSPEGVCVPLGFDLNDKISSLGPDQGTYCRFFWEFGCPSANSECTHADYTYPGVLDLSQVTVCNTNHPNDQYSSYWCFPQ